MRAERSTDRRAALEGIVGRGTRRAKTTSPVQAKTLTTPDLI